MKETIQWNDLWKRDCSPGEKSEELDFWNSFAPRYRKKLPEGEDPYVERFYEYAGLKEGETVFDMGCGPGTLAIPFAGRGHEIYAADFSPRMLEHLMLAAEEEGVSDRIHPIRLDWDEDWSVRDLPVCDVSISSRSFMPYDLTKALKDLESVARSRVCIGAWDTPSKGYIREAGQAIGYERPGYGCYVYIMGELMDRDMMPDLRWITNPFRRRGHDMHASREDAVRSLKESFRYGLTEEQESKLDELIDRKIKSFEKDGARYWKIDLKERSTIAFIRWDVR